MNASSENSSPWIEMSPGLKRQTISSGRTMMQMRVRLAAGSQLPEHKHPHEQITFVLSGRLRLDVGGVVVELLPGQSQYIRADLPHAAEATMDTEVIDTFSPPREDLLAQDHDAH